MHLKIVIGLVGLASAAPVVGLPRYRTPSTNVDIDAAMADLAARPHGTQDPAIDTFIDPSAPAIGKRSPQVDIPPIMFDAPDLSAPPTKGRWPGSGMTKRSPQMDIPPIVFDGPGNLNGLVKRQGGDVPPTVLGSVDFDELAHPAIGRWPAPSAFVKRATDSLNAMNINEVLAKMKPAVVGSMNIDAAVSRGQNQATHTGTGRLIPPM